MLIDIDFPARHPNGSAYLNWTPRKVSVRLVDAQGANPPRIQIKSRGPTPMVFLTAPDQTGVDPLELDLPDDGSPLEFWVTGVFQSPSLNPDDSGFVIEHAATGAPLFEQLAMLRVRKSANSLTVDERDRFLDAMGALNASGTGRFRDFRDMHVGGRPSQEAHFDMGFLPWHRAYLLDLERELQAIDPAVALPYWLFTEASPNVFTTAFMGLPNSVGRLEFDTGHALESWATDGQLGIIRAMGFPPDVAPTGIRSETDTLALAAVGGNQYRGFATMEVNPHGRAHTRFTGASFISQIPQAARDPLFFMLHCNVDRLWAKWQWLNRLHDAANPQAFNPSLNGRVGHNLVDRMWPWNQVMGFPRPETAPGGGLAMAPDTPAPGDEPQVMDMLDYQGILGSHPLGFDYEDVPFEFYPGPTPSVIW